MAEKKTCHVFKCEDLVVLSISIYDDEGEPVIYRESCQAHGIETFVKWLMDPNFSDYENIKFKLI